MAKPVEVGHEGFNCQFWVDRGLEVKHGCVGILCDSLEYLVPEQ